MSPGDATGIGPGQIGLILLLLLAAAVAVIGFALTRSLRAAQRRVEYPSPGEPGRSDRRTAPDPAAVPPGEAPPSPATTT